MTLPSDAVLCVYTATEGSNAIWSGHVWFKTASGAAFCYSSLGSEIKCLTVMEKKRITQQKSKCHVESEIRFDIELCWGI